MAKPGAFQDGMQCPRCGANWRPKYGRFRSRQTYRCGPRHCRFVPGTGLPHQPEQLKAEAAKVFPRRSFSVKIHSHNQQTGTGLLQPNQYPDEVSYDR